MSDTREDAPELGDLDDYEEFPRAGGPGRTVAAVVAVLLVLGLAGAAAGWIWYQGKVDPSGPPGEEVAFTVPEGASTQRIGELLAEAGIISDARVFRLWLRFNDAGPFQAGDYSLHRNSSFPEVVAALERGPQLTFQRLTVPEGLTLEQIAERVGTLPGRSAERFLEVAASGQVRSRFQPAGVTTLEGLLLPETYNFEEADDEAAILRRMVEAMDATLVELGVEAGAQAAGVSPYEVVIVASLVEREAKRGVDRGPIAEVIYNRLEKGMRLQIDATVLYALGEHKNRVLFKDLEVDSPYNTYKVAGLPPTPIAAPGRAALEAAITPPEHDFLFYVTINDCTAETVFAETSAQHSRNVARRRAENC